MDIELAVSRTSDKETMPRRKVEPKAAALTNIIYSQASSQVVSAGLVYEIS